MTAVAAVALASGHFSAAQTWSDRNLYVFGGNVVVDLRQRIETNGASPNWGMVDCSDANYFCAESSGVFNLVVPKACAVWKVGDAWRTGKDSTEVLAEASRYDFAPTHPRLNATYYLVGNAQRPHTVFVYDPFVGVLEIVTDFTGQFDLVKVARESGFGGIRNLPDAARLRNRLTTKTEFPGACHGVERRP